jgi:hypothetical protein
MITRYLVTGALAMACAVSVATAQQNPAGANQQNPADRQQQQPQTPPAASTAQGPSVTLVGCLQREEDVPGRRPNIAERAGVLEDYILTGATMKAEAAPPADPARPSGGAVGTTGSTPATGSMYKIEGIPDERLKQLVGRRVEVMGRIDEDDLREARPSGAAGQQQPGGAPKPGDDMPEFEATSIREIEGTCPVASGR